MGVIEKMATDFSELKQLQNTIEKLVERVSGDFCEECVKELGARFLSKVIKRTPVGDYRVEEKVKAKRDTKKHKKGEVYSVFYNPTGKVGGTLRRGWTCETQAQAEKGEDPGVQRKLARVQVMRNGEKTWITLTNPVSYASYVEYGHRQTPGRFVPAIGKSLVKAFVPGVFMMTNAEKEVKEIQDAVVGAKLKKFFERGGFS